MKLATKCWQSTQEYQKSSQSNYVLELYDLIEFTFEWKELEAPLPISDANFESFEPSSNGLINLDWAYYSQ